MARIALITGATGGLGEKFVERICLLNDIDEVWATGRNKEKLESLKKISKKVVPVIADLSVDGTDIIKDLVKEKEPDIRMLVNNAGVAYMGEFGKMDAGEIESFVKVNCSAPAVLMERGYSMFPRHPLSSQTLIFRCIRPARSFLRTSQERWDMSLKSERSPLHAYALTGLIPGCFRGKRTGK